MSPLPFPHPYPSRAQALRAALVLAVVALVTFGPHAHEIGFYSDDWVFLEKMASGGSWWERVKALGTTNWVFRTLMMLYYPAVYSLFGESTLGYQVVMGLQVLAVGCLYYLLVRRLFGHERLALTASVFALLLPLCHATHVWVAMLCQNSAMALMLGSALLHLDYVESGRRGARAAALALFGLGMILYEAAAFYIPATLAAALFWADWRSGKDPKSAAKEQALKVLLPYGALLAAGMLWQKQLVPAVFKMPYWKPVTPTVRWFFKTYLDAVEVLGPELWKLTFKIQRASWELAFPAARILWVAFALWLARRLARGSKPEEPLERLGAAAALAAIGLFAAYLPFALSGNYEPQIAGLLNRINGTAILPFGLLLAVGLEAAAEAARRKGVAFLGTAARSGAVALLVFSFTGTNWFIYQQWADAWKLQNMVLERVQPWVAGMPYLKTVVLVGAPPHVNGSAAFNSHWAFDAALRLRTGRKELRGLVQTPGMATEPQGLVDRSASPPVTHPYDGLFLFDFNGNKMLRPVPAK